ncbi:Crp/Fnr family transcriptional regulator [Myroides marinus]|nr:Crp/Fnr family transcriptional regulator [Myroides marinus]MDM1357314.1 Crp/Fnr family transcriptional regulator [Myroides marinus]MDM1501502.1 Crp/Fnr family transcriptional regulator [Myroides marinus]
MNKELLMKYGAELVHYKKDDFIFEEGMLPDNFYFICSGQVKLNKFDASDETKEFIYDIYSKGQFFGDPSIFLDLKYLCNAIAVNSANILVLPKSDFLKMLKENQYLNSQIHYVLSEKLYYQGVMAPIISSQDAENRIMTLLNHFKDNSHCVLAKPSYEVDLTRQQIGDMTGLRVETVIRTIKRLKLNNKLRIIKGKIVL